MWVSDKYQIQWWLPPRTASRMTAEFLRKLDFHQEWGHHVVYGESRYDVYLNIRNPYSITVSRYFMSGTKSKTFDEFVKGFELMLIKERSYLNDYVAAFRDRELTPKKIIRYENLIEDLLSVDFIKENERYFSVQIEKLKKGVEPWREKYDPTLVKPYSEFYTQELADIVYNLFAKFFEFGNYERDSWKTLIN